MAGTLPTLTSDTDTEAVTRPARRPFRDNPKLILAGIAVLVALLVAAVGLANRSSGLAPDYLAEFVLYGLIAADLTMVTALVFVLARNIVKLVVERRRGRPFARFRAKLVALLIAMTLVPAMLVLAVGSELIRTSVGRWFNQPMDEILTTANAVAGDYYQERQRQVTERAERVARLLSEVDLTSDETSAVRALVEPELGPDRVQVLQVYRAVPGNAGAAPAPAPVLDVMVPNHPARASRDVSDGLAARLLQGSAESTAARASPSSASGGCGGSGAGTKALTVSPPAVVLW